MFFYVCNQRLKKFIDKNIKKYKSGSFIVDVGIKKGTQLTKYVINFKFKTYGSKFLFAITLSLVVQFISLFFYVFTYSSKFKKFAIATTRIDSIILKKEIRIIN